MMENKEEKREDNFFLNPCNYKNCYDCPLNGHWEDPMFRLGCNNGGCMVKEE